MKYCATKLSPDKGMHGQTTPKHDASSMHKNPTPNRLQDSSIITRRCM